ncbi:NAD-dependent epimerase/dehydratase family protein [Kineococcus vitellinus]|uniref:NAD-dependent epimerase/dehydratase family protein n=1 Tax=Kineococcus vitellinus TaxID=2696565 RepID=UPI00196AD0FF|nr:NAD-dependent epimerase/dehydratase family protein [Kineococcus vitellinus]
MRLLVLGGTRFVGRAVVREALERGWEVTALHRGRTGSTPAGVRVLRADRTDVADLAAALSAPGAGGAGWDAVVDTWSGAPRAVGDAARLLAGRAGRYAYVSSSSVYAWGRHVDEGSPLVEGDPRALEGDYPALKRGAELAALAVFEDALLARAGLILGPHEDVGRLPWWLLRTARGGRVVAPGRPGRPLQHVDVRDLAAWLLSGLAGGLSGAVDVAGPSGHASTADLLGACARVTGAGAELVWFDEDELAAAGAEPWTHLPCWVPEHGEFAGFLEADTRLAARTGLVCRPVAETVADTWEWVRREGVPPQRPDRSVHGLPPEVERRLLSLRPG